MTSGSTPRLSRHAVVRDRGRLTPTVAGLGKFYDHDDGVEPADKARHDLSVGIAGANRTIVKAAGDTIPLSGVQVRVLVSEGPVIANSVNGGGPNPRFASAPLQAPAAPENVRMVALSMTYNNFKYASLADSDWSREMELACPVNKLGHVNLYTINSHGAGPPRRDRAAGDRAEQRAAESLGQKVENLKILNANYTPYETHSYLCLTKLPGIEGVWQGHRSLIDPDPAHNLASDMIANLEEGAGDAGNPITATVAANGKFTVTNARNNFSKTYTAK